MFKLTPFKLMASSKTSRVVPAISVTIARSSPTKTFNNEDFPAFGLPTITVLIPSFIILPLSDVERSFLTSFPALISPSRYSSSRRSLGAPLRAVQRRGESPGAPPQWSSPRLGHVSHHVGGTDHSHLPVRQIRMP